MAVSGVGGLRVAGQVGNGGVEGVEEGGVIVAVEEALFVNHVGEALGGGAEGVEEGHGLIEVGDAVAEFEDAAGDGAQHSDLGGEVGGFEVVEVFELSLAEVAGVEAVAEGVGVAGLGAAFTGWGHGGSSRGGAKVCWGISRRDAENAESLVWRKGPHLASPCRRAGPLLMGEGKCACPLRSNAGRNGVRPGRGRSQGGSPMASETGAQRDYSTDVLYLQRGVSDLCACT